MAHGGGSAGERKGGVRGRISRGCLGDQGVYQGHSHGLKLGVVIFRDCLDKFNGSMWILFKLETYERDETWTIISVKLPGQIYF